MSYTPIYKTYENSAQCREDRTQDTKQPCVLYKGQKQIQKTNEGRKEELMYYSFNLNLFSSVCVIICYKN